jgi:hypothetical protein
MRKALPAGTASEIVLYPDTPHAVHADYRPSYREAAAKDGWARALAWFKKYGVAHGAMHSQIQKKHRCHRCCCRRCRANPPCAAPPMPAAREA